MKIRYCVALALFGLRLCSAHGQALPSGNRGPVYPLAAKAAGIEGQVIVFCTITKEGKVRNAYVMTGPRELRQAALDAVKSWTYKPYRNNGELVEIDTKVVVNFNMGKGAEKAAQQAKAQAELAKLSQGSTPADATPQQTPSGSTPTPKP